jgi:neutral ceramidase
MKTCSCFGIAIAILSFTATSLAGEATAGWRAGVASTVVTPKMNMWMGGYAARTHASVGTAQDLHAKALVIADSAGGRFAFITVDAIGIPRELRKNMEKRLAEAYQLQPHQFVITASHTHSGPEFRAGRVPAGAPGGEQASQAYLGRLEETFHVLVGKALSQLAPVKLAYARARAGFAMNRRLPRPNGEFVNAPNPEGAVDHDVPVLRVDSMDGQLRAVLFGYACHNTTLTQGNYEFCGDYAGYAQQYVQEDQPGAVALFMTGCGGDQNPYPRGTLPLAQAHGRTLATAVQAALGTKARPLSGTISSASRPLSGTISSAYAETALRYAPAPSRAEYEARLTSKEKQLAGHAQRMLDRWDKQGGLPTTYTYPVQVIQLGRELTMVALGGEVVVDYSLRLKRELGGSGAVWVAGYSNDVLGYIPTERVLREGGYEGLSASRLGSLHPSPWAPGLEAQIIGQVHELAQAVMTKPSVTPPSSKGTGY